MSRAYRSLFFHLIWTTKKREPFFSKAGREKLYAYIKKLVTNENSEIIAIGGVEDHVHLLVRIPSLNGMTKLIRNVKSYSSKFVKSQGERCSHFSWQSSYGIFCVSPSMIKVVSPYILNQEEHHKRISFDDELNFFLRF